jgi:hypothetical protein
MKYLRSAIVIVIFNLASFIAEAQPGDPGGGGNPTVPITGIEYLLMGGAAMGLRNFLLRHRKPKN